MHKLISSLYELFKSLWRKTPSLKWKRKKGKKKQQSYTTLKEKIRLFQKEKNESYTNLSQVGNNFTSLHSSIVVFINQKWLNNHKDLQEIRPSSVNGMNIKSILPKKKMHWSIATIYLTLWTNGRTRSSSLYRILSMTFTNKWRSCKQKKLLHQRDENDWIIKNKNEQGQL